jgi:septal ring factor EnvC (AmiA/AmiB activator)
MSQFDTALDELQFLLANYFPKGWTPKRDAILGVYVPGVEFKHAYRAMELLTAAMECVERPDDRGDYQTGYEDAESEFEAERQTLQEEIADTEAEVSRLEKEIKRLEDLLQYTRSKIHVSNEDEE